MIEGTEKQIEMHERLATLETNQTNFMKELEKLDKKLDENFADLKNLITDELNKKAGKWVEKVLIWLGAIIGAGVLGFLGSIIIKVIELK